MSRKTTGRRRITYEINCDRVKVTAFTLPLHQPRPGYPTLYPEELQIFGVVMAFIHKTRGMD
jgi:hypothetical protein